MKMHSAVWRLVALGSAILVFGCRAQLVLESSSGNGRIVWQVPQAPSTCRVEWATSAVGPWYNTWDSMCGILATGTTAGVAFPVFFRVVQPQTWAEDGLVFWMPCNGDLRDHSPCGNHPVAGGMVGLQPDRAGNAARAVRFDLGEFMSVPGNPTLVTTNLTLALWAKFDTVSNFPWLLEMTPHNAVWSMFVDQIGTTPNPGWWYLRGGSTSALPVQETLQTNRWYHLAATLRGTQAILYQDGVPRRTGTVAAASSAIDTMYIGRPVVVYGPSTNHWRFSGAMDDIRVYNRVLTATEIASLQALAP